MVAAVKTTVAAGSAAGGGSLAVATILIYLLSLRGVQVPDGVALAFAALLTTAFHYLIALKLLPNLPDDPADATMTTKP